MDEDLSVEGLLHGTPARRPRPRAAIVKVRAQSPLGEASQQTGRQRPPQNAGRLATTLFTSRIQCGMARLLTRRFRERVH